MCVGMLLYSTLHILWTKITIVSPKTLMNVWSPMEDVNMFVRTLMAAIHVHVTVDIYLEWMSTIVMVHIC